MRIPDHTNSATAAFQSIRSLTTFSFPLFTPKVYSALVYRHNCGVHYASDWDSGAFGSMEV